MRQLRDIRLSRPSLVVLAVVSGLATAVILSSGSGRSSAQLAALAALRQHPVAVTTSPAPSSGRAAQRPATPASTQSAGGGGSGPAPVGSSVSSTTPSVPASTPAGGGPTTSSPSSPSSHPPAHADRAMVSHVFEISLSTTSYDAVFGSNSAAPYLRSLESKGTLLSGVQSLGAGELADNLALVSGQGPNPDTAAGCTTYAEFSQGASAKANGLVPGDGCVYPETALTIGDQVSASGHVWKSYIADMGKEACAHPNSNAPADVALPGTEPGYDQTHNPFIYFHSLLDLGDCASDDEDLSRLTADLSKQSRTATFSFIAPGACDDAATVATPESGDQTTTTSTTSTTTSTSSMTTPTSTPAPPVCPTGDPIGISGEDAFLKLWVPRILASPAYRARGLLIIAFTAVAAGSDGHPVRTGALVLSPRSSKHGTISSQYEPYSILRSIEDALGFSPLAYAKSARSFVRAVLR